MKIYLAGALFSAAERDFNIAMAAEIKQLSPDIEVTLPQDRAKLFLGQTNQNTAIYEDCIEQIKISDVIVAILDGPDADSGTCIELGYARAIGKLIFGIRTDLRASEERGLNLMVAFVCDELIWDTDALVSALATRVVAFCRQRVAAG